MHYGEMPSAPYSMKDREHAVFTQTNNVVGTLNVLWAIRDLAPECHLVKLGTMGEYGTPEHRHRGGVHRDRAQRPHRLPALPEAAGVDVPPVEGPRLATTSTSPAGSGGCGPPTSTRASSTASRPTRRELDDRLLTRFDYDDVFGTALNRFCLQAVIGHPLTVYGKGGQTRGYLNIVDTLQCVELAVLNPADAGEFRVFNQFTESFSIMELAELVQKAGARVRARGRDRATSTTRGSSRRSTTTTPKHTKLLDLGLQPHLLSRDAGRVDVLGDRAVPGPGDRRPHPAARPVAAAASGAALTTVRFLGRHRGARAVCLPGRPRAYRAPPDQPPQPADLVGARGRS